VVTEVDVRALHAPSIRLHLNAAGDQVADPIELDLRQHEGTQLTCLAPGQDPTSRSVTRFAPRAPEREEQPERAAQTGREQTS
jgi:hypothetical protein